MSNRAKNLESQSLLDLVSSLHETYRKFDELLEWRKISLDESWDAESKQWSHRTRWEYGRTILEPERGDAGLN